MHIKSLTLRNFKGIGDVPQTIEFAPITLLFGPNSAGKSTILHALLYLHEILSNGNCSPEFTNMGGKSIDLGGFFSLVHAHDLTKSIGMSVEFSLDEYEIPDFLSAYESDELSDMGLPYTFEFFQSIDIAKINFEISWSNQQRTAYVSKYEVYLDEGLVCSVATSPEHFDSVIEKLALDAEPFQFEMDEDTGFPSFNMMLSLLVSSRWNASREDMLIGERPFFDYLVEDMRAVIEDGDYTISVLKQLQYELAAHRTKASAKRLEIEVDLLLLEMEKSIENSANISGVPLVRTTDGIFNFNRILQIPDEFWDESEEELQPFQLYKRFAESIITSSVIGPAKCLSDWLDEYTYIGPIRSVPPRNYLPSFQNKSQDWASGMAAWDLVGDLPSKKLEDINFWLENGLETGFEVHIREFHEKESWVDTNKPVQAQTNRRVMFRRTSGKRTEVLPSDIGVGISQVFPVVVLACTKESGLAAIEQPELHIHPKLQVDIADLFINSVKKNQSLFLLETHSEHLLLRLLRRVREAKEESPFSIDSNMLSVIYVENNSEGSKYTNLKVTEDGDFEEGWPDGFFDERDEELF